MRNPLGILPKLNLVIDLSSARYSAINCISRTLSTLKSLENPDGAESQSIEKAKQIISSTRFAKNSKIDFLYLLDEKEAKKFASLIAANNGRNWSHVIQVNPGVGFLTKELLDAGIPFVNLIEERADFRPYLISLGDKYPNRISMENMNFKRFLNLGFIDWKAHSKKFDSYFQNVKRRRWREEPAVQIVCAMSDSRLIHALVYNAIFQNILSVYGRQVLYAAVPPSVSAHLQCNNQHYNLYTQRIIVFQALFRYEILGELPRSVFHPKLKYSKKIRNKCQREIRVNDAKFMHVVKIEPRIDIFDKDFTESDMMPFYYFVGQHLRSRKNRIIPSLENSIPGCGRVLIPQGYTIFTEFGELLPDDIRELFKRFKSLPGYEKSTFMSCFNTFLERIDEYSVFDENREHIDEMFQSSLKELEIQTKKLKD